MTEPTPSSIRTFETLQILSVVIGLVHVAIIGDLGIWDAVVMVGPLLALTLLVSRKRKNWAKLALAVLFVGGMVFMIAMRDQVFVQGYPLATLVVTVLQGVALGLLYTKSASSWLTLRPVN
jgi:hypothetical protein